ncbi:MFS transporter [Vallitalea okinawensis]|uniref:MFS transporter n=1 Tax=Vallitalea okinawensis TaxID=2078660 RepID=UPI000CFC4669|nr:MFS transporter [Vallitalea okinawensis]
MKQNKSLGNMFLYLGGTFVSLFGTSIYGFAMSFFILSITESPLFFSISMLLSVLPRLILSPFAGVIVDNYDKKKLVLLFDALSGILMLIMFAVSTAIGLQIWMIYLSTVLLSSFNTLFGISFFSAIPNLVDDKHLGKINSLNQTASSLSSILGPIIGGIVYALVPVQAFLLINGISFLASTVAEALIDFKYNLKEKELKQEAIKEEQETRNMFAQMGEGMKYMKDQKLLFELLKGSLFINFFFGAVNVGLPIIIVLVLKCSEKALGTVESGVAIGMFLFSIILAMQKRIKFNKKVYVLLLIAVAVLEGIFAIPVLSNGIVAGELPIILFYFSGMFIIGCLVIGINVPVSVVMQERIDPLYRGRVMSLVSMISQAITPIGMILYGVLYEHVDAYVILLASALGLLLVTLRMAYNFKGIDLEENKQVIEEVV